MNNTKPITIAQQKTLINTAFNELSSEMNIEHYQQVYSGAEGLRDAIIYQDSSKFINKPITTTINPFNDCKKLLLDFNVKLDLSSKVLQHLPTNKVFKLFSLFPELFPQNLTMITLNRNIHRHLHFHKNPRWIEDCRKYDLPLLSKMPFKTLKSNDLTIFFGIIEKIVNADTNNKISKKEIIQTVDGFLHTNLDKIDINNKINYIIMKLKNDYPELAEKYSILFNHNQNESLFAEEKVNLDSISINKKTFLKQFPINTSSGIAGNSTYKQAIEYILTKIKYSQNITNNNIIPKLSSGKIYEHPTKETNLLLAQK